MIVAEGLLAAGNPRNEERDTARHIVRRLEKARGGGSQGGSIRAVLIDHHGHALRRGLVVRVERLAGEPERRRERLAVHKELEVTGRQVWHGLLQPVDRAQP